jgi:hypothetical protein
MIARTVELDTVSPGDGLELGYAGVGVLVDRLDARDAELRFGESRVWLPLARGRRFRERFDRLFVRVPTATAGGRLVLLVLEREREDVLGG